MKKFLSILIVTSFAFAGEGSLYSRFGIGEIVLSSDGRTIGMGHNGVGLFAESNINVLNPASLSSISRTLVTATYQFRNYASSDAFGTSTIRTGGINEIAVAFPIYSPKKMVLALGLVPYTTMGFEQEVEQTVNGISLTQQFEGRGGVSSAQLSLSYSPMSELAVGFTGQYLFGALYRDQLIHFSSSQYYGGSYNQTQSIGGVAVTLGGIYTGIEKLMGISESKNINLGVTLFSGSSLDLDQETLRNYSSNQDTINLDNQSISLPLGFTLGLSYSQKSILYAVDFSSQNWSNYKINGLHPSELQNSYRIGGGIEFKQSDNIADSFWERIAYRLGTFYRVTNVKVNGESINEIFGTGGIGFPLSFDSRLNLGFEYGIRGTTSSSLVKDTIIRFTVSMAASELMFIQPPIE